MVVVDTPASAGVSGLQSVGEEINYSCECSWCYKLGNGLSPMDLLCSIHTTLCVVMHHSV